jgi:hypothetical protein
MQLFLGWLLVVFPGLLYVGQIISSISFPFAQKLGLQESPDQADSLLQRAERYTAFWDLLTLCWLPLSGILMIVDHSAWPLFAVIGGAIYLDAAGREAAKILSFKHEGIRVGEPGQHRIFFSIYLIMAALGFVVVIYSIAQVCN